MLKLAVAAPVAAINDNIPIKCKGFFTTVPDFPAADIFKSISYTNVNPFASLVNG
jgi:hypothetical protein